MNKSLYTNIIALSIMLLGISFKVDLLYYIGVFSLAGAVTNWLAIHMLFEKVPGLYGSGVIPARFKEFKAGIKVMIMEQFFNSENLDRFLHSEAKTASINLPAVVDKVDFTPTFDGLVEVIQQSSFGAMLEMVGGVAAIEPMREPFVAKIKQSIIEVSQSEDFQALIAKELGNSLGTDQLIQKVERILEQRLQELTPELVKDIVKKMIREHLGWLVVWGGVFGGAIGAVASIW
jgi:uncharacterized membrane protein YheB (UPF0754 family)